MEKHKILITGHSGFLGQALVSKLQTENNNLLYFLSSSTSSKSLENEFIGPIQDKEFVEKAINEISPDIVIHLASFMRRTHEIASYEKSIETNILGTLNLLSALKNRNCAKSIIILGTGEEYGDNPIPFKESFRERPQSSYSFSKTAQTHLAQNFAKFLGLPITILRPSLIYGPGQRPEMLIPVLINKLINNEEFKTSPGDQTRDFIYVDDVVDAIIKAYHQLEHSGQIYNVSSNEEVEIKNICLLIGKIMNKGKLLNIGAISHRENEVMRYKVDNSLIKEKLNWSPSTSLEEGLQKTVTFYLGCSH